MSVYIKRLAGKEDIFFDSQGLNENNNETGKVVTAINATHVPTTAGCRALLHAGNVEDSLLYLKRQIDNFSLYSVLDKDTAVNFLPTDDLGNIQSRINVITKNLNGFTLTFNFADNIDLAILQSIIFEKFYNGNLVINGKNITLSDSANIGQLIIIDSCNCNITIKNLKVTHTLSPYGIKFINSFNAICENILFTGYTISYALLVDLTNVKLTDCNYLNDKNYLLSGVYVDYIASELQKFKDSVDGSKMNIDLYNINTAGKLRIVEYLLPDYSRASSLLVNTTGVSPTCIGWLVGAPGARTLTINDVQVARGLTPTLENAGVYVTTTTSHAQIQILVQPSDVIKVNSSTLTFSFIPCKGVQ